MSIKQSALVTGAAQGLGAAIAHKLASRGINVLVADLNEKKGREVVQELKDTYGVDSIFVKADVGNEEDVKNMVQAAADRWGRLDYACNNAALPELIALTEDEASTEIFDKMYHVCQKGVWLCQRYEALQMLKQEPLTVTIAPTKDTVQSRGAVVNISSTAAIMAVGQPGYSASKAAIQSITRTGCQFYGPSNIRINTVSPGAMATSGFDPWLKTLAQDAREIVESVVTGPPAKRMAFPAEVAATVSWLLSDESTFMQGANVVCDGGFTVAKYTAAPV